MEWKLSRSKRLRRIDGKGSLCSLKNQQTPTKYLCPQAISMVSTGELVGCLMCSPESWSEECGTEIIVVDTDLKRSVEAMMLPSRR